MSHFIGVNNRIQLADAEAVILNRNRQRIMAEGTTIHLPESCYIEDDVKVGADSVIMGPCYLKGKQQLLLTQQLSQIVYWKMQASKREHYYQPRQHSKEIGEIDNMCGIAGYIGNENATNTFLKP